MRKRISTLILLLAVDCAYGVYPVWDGADIAQNAANAAHTINTYYQEVEQVKNQLAQIQYKIQELQSSKLQTITDVTDHLNNISDIASAGNSMSYATSDLSKNFDKTFGNGKGKQGNYIDQSNERLQKVLDTSKATLQSTQKQMQYNIQESASLNQITKASNDAQGTKAVLQNTNQLLDANAAQMQSMKQMLAQQQSQQVVEAAAKASREKQLNQIDQDFVNYKPVHDQYKPDPTLNQIPAFD